MTLAEKLNKYGARPSVERGKVTIEFEPPDECLDSTGTVTDQALNDLIDAVEDLGYLDHHPEGSAGGYVIWLEHGGETAWFDEHGDNCWKAR